MAKASKAWGAIADQTARLAEEGRQIGKPIAPKTDEAIALQPQEPVASSPPAPRASASQPVAEVKVEKRSTSLYLSGAASRAIKTLAASRGVRPHRVIDEALAEYLAKAENGGLDFHALNAKD